MKKKARVVPYKLLKIVAVVGAFGLILSGQKVALVAAGAAGGILITILGVALLVLGVKLPQRGSWDIDALGQVVSGGAARRSKRSDLPARLAFRLADGLAGGSRETARSVVRYLAQLPRLPLILFAGGVGLIYLTHAIFHNAGRGLADMIGTALGFACLLAAAWPSGERWDWRGKKNKLRFSFKRLPLMLAVFLLAAGGLSFYFKGKVLAGTIFIVLALLSLLHSIPQDDLQRVARVRRPAVGRSRNWVGPLSILVAGGAFSYFTRGGSLPAAGLTLVFLCVALYFGGRGLAEAGQLGAKDKLDRNDWLLLSGALALAFFFRAYHIGILPWGIHPDESTHVRWSLSILDGVDQPLFLNVWHYCGATLYNYLVALMIKIFGFTVPVFRMAAVLPSVLMVFYLYLFSRRLFGRRVAFFASLVLAVSYWPVVMSRVSFHWVYPPMLLVAGLYHLLRGVDEGRNLQFMLAGVLFGMSPYFYPSFVMIPVIVFVYIVYLCLRDRYFLARRWPGLIVMGGAAIIVALPAIHAYFFRFTGMGWAITQSSLNAADGLQQPLAFIMRNVWAYPLTFFHRTSGSIYMLMSAEPIMDVYSAALLIIGLCLLIFSWRRERMFLLGIWFLFGFLPAMVSHSKICPDLWPYVRRLTLTLPLVSLLVGLVLSQSYGILRDVLGRGRRRWWALICAGALLLLITGANYRSYFVQYAGDVGIWEQFALSNMLPSQLARRLAERGAPRGEVGDDTAVYISDFWREGVDFHLHGIRNSLFSVGNVNSLLRPGDGAERAIILLEPVYREVDPWLRSFYPGAERQELADPAPGKLIKYNDKYNNDLMAIAYVIDADDYKAARGLELVEYSEPGLTGEKHERKVRELSWRKEREQSAVWQGSVLIAQQGEYIYQLAGQGSFSLRLNGKERLAGELTGGARQVRLFQEQGFHRLEVRLDVGRQLRLEINGELPGGEKVALGWRELFPGDRRQGLLGKYYAYGTRGKSAPLLQRLDPLLLLRWNVQRPPYPGLVFPFEVEWSGVLLAPQDGEYKFDMAREDACAVYVDGIEAYSLRRNKLFQRTVSLSKGEHSLRVVDEGTGINSTVILYWSRDSGEKEVVSHLYLRPR